LRSSLTVHKAAHYVCLAQIAERTSTQTNLALEDPQTTDPSNESIGGWWPG
jgi:hypothetical protein